MLAPRRQTCQVEEQIRKGAKPKGAYIVSTGSSPSSSLPLPGSLSESRAPPSSPEPESGVRVARLHLWSHVNLSFGSFASVVRSLALSVQVLAPAVRVLTVRVRVSIVRSLALFIRVLARAIWVLARTVQVLARTAAFNYAKSGTGWGIVIWFRLCMRPPSGGTSAVGPAEHDAGMLEFRPRSSYDEYWRDSAIVACTGIEQGHTLGWMSGQQRQDRPRIDLFSQGRQSGTRVQPCGERFVGIITWARLAVCTHRVEVLPKQVVPSHKPQSHAPCPLTTTISLALPAHTARPGSK